MADLFNIGNLGDLVVLIFLQAVLGFDNLLYISIESKRAPKESRAAVRKWGILIAVALRVVLLFVMIKALASFQAPFFEVQWTGVLEGAFNFATVVFLIGGAFLMWTAIKEIGHLLAIEDLEKAGHPDDSTVERSLRALLELYGQQGRKADAEAIRKKIER